MTRLEKVELSDDYKTFYVVTDGGVFSIATVDYNIFFKPEIGSGRNDRYLSQNDEYSFRISVNDKEVYDVFDRLYTAVENRMPYSNGISDFDEKDYVLPEYVDMKSENKLFVNGVRLHSDDTDYESSSILTIEKKEKYMDVNFTKSKVSNDPTFMVKMTVGSPRYYHYSTTFMNMIYDMENCYKKENNKGYQRVRKEKL